MKKNQQNILTEDMERMRQTVVDLELKARYWKANYELKKYTIEDSKLTEEYAQLIKETMEKREKAIAEVSDGVSIALEKKEEVTDAS